MNDPASSSTGPTRARAGSRAALALAGLALAAACTTYPQRLPGPLYAPGDRNGPEGVASGPAPGAATVTVQRDSDPVWVRMPGERGEYSVPFYRKRERVPAGALVRTGAGGRAELLWSPDATSVVLFDECRLTLGDAEKDEPLVRFHSVTHALLTLTPEDRIELSGGALLTGDPQDTTATVLLEEAPGQVLRVTNQSKKLIALVFREERLELGAGESLDLPHLGTGGEPRTAEAEPERFAAARVELEARGRTQHEADDSGVTVTALEPAVVRALGVLVQLEAEAVAHFSALAQVAPAPAADPSAKP